MSRSILVTGATDKQGGAVIQALLTLNADFNILALTRNINSKSAKQLAAKSDKIKLIAGDMDHPDDFFKAAKDATGSLIWGVFSVHVLDAQNTTNEEQQGKALIDASLSNDVKFFVYTSVDRGGDRSDNNPTDIPHFISKHNVEQHLYPAAANKMDWCVLRPVALFESFTPNFFGRAFATWWDTALKGKPLQLVAMSDIGEFAAKAFENPEAYRGTKISLAGEELTLEDARRTFKEVTGKEMQTTYKPVAGLMLRMFKDIGYMFRWFHDTGYGVDIVALKREHPGLKGFRTWLETESEFRKK